MIDMKGMEEEIIEQEQQDDNNYLEVGMHCSYIMTNCLLFTLFTCRSNSLYKRLLDGFLQKVWSIARRYHQSMHLKFIDMKNVEEKIHSQEDDDDKFTFMDDFLDNMNLSRSSYITAIFKVLLYIYYILMLLQNN